MADNGYRAPDYVFGGFHLFNPTHKKSEAPELIRSVGEYLSNTPSVYYTGHCTGQEAYDQLKGMMGDRMRYMATGSVIEI
jgi:7,8-dihydropterin-6-yl-methyl-4-(beta-D-ribofuranosyl)aminobenzene 5'-phosphate synthase